MRTRRVGSITCGIVMIFFGILFMVHMFYPALSLEVIMRLWPIILIALGGEMIAANLLKEEDKETVLTYDKGAIFLVFLLTCFAIGMGILEYIMECYSQYTSIYF